MEEKKDEEEDRMEELELDDLEDIDSMLTEVKKEFHHTNNNNNNNNSPVRDSNFQTIELKSSSPTNSPTLSYLHPGKTIIAFDLHHVLMRPMYKDMAKIIWNYSEKAKLAKVLTSPSLFRRFISRVGREVPEKQMKDLRASFAESEEEAASIHLSNVISEICNSQEPDMETFQVVDELKAMGYKIYLLSNIGSDYFEDLIKKMPEDLFKSFDGFYTTNPDDDYTMKPNPRIYKSFLARYNADSFYENIVFVDDSSSNVSACNIVGMTGIVYKNAQQLRLSLREVGIFIPLPVSMAKKSLSSSSQNIYRSPKRLE